MAFGLFVRLRVYVAVAVEHAAVGAPPQKPLAPVVTSNNDEARCVPFTYSDAAG